MIPPLSEGLEKAADYMEEHGWTQNTSVNFLGQVCTSGAVTRAVQKMRLPSMHAGPYRNLLLKTLAEKVRPGSEGKAYASVVVRWNDNDCETEQEALDLLRTTAKEQRVKEEGIA